MTATLAVPSPTSAEVLELPLVASSLPGYEARQRYASRNTPPEIVDRLNREINAAFADTARQSRFAAISGDALPASPAAFGGLVAGETEKRAEVVKFARPKVEQDPPHNSRAHRIGLQCPLLNIFGCADAEKRNYRPRRMGRH